ncbi:carboxymuconolactone decarboxylase family protein [Paraburkholderia acidipaludis]|uniref:carboxymuconolactone decarboxylase family protein n=1 Tax=Paraburkholderia acidipaludis TaxID=660537 RepID=UPI0038990FD5
MRGACGELGVPPGRPHFPRGRRRAELSAPASYAWGEIWTREGLPRHTRSLLTIAMMVALNRSEELALHLRSAKNNGVTREEIKEVLLQTAIYCGVPAANSAYHLADRIFREEDGAQS